MQQAAVHHLSDLERTPEEDQLLWTAEEELVRACMLGRGFTYIPSPTSDEPEPEPEIGHSRTRAGDVDRARSEGYGLFEHLGERDVPHQGIDPNAESLARMTAEKRSAFLEALRGPTISAADPRVRHEVESVPLPGGGAAYWYRDSCLAQARHQLYGTDYEHNELGYSQSVFQNELRAHADEDPEYRTRLETWRGCMLTHGFDEERPEAAADRLASDFHAGKLSAAELHAHELSIATADAECYQLADLDQARQHAEARAEQRLLAQNSEQLSAMKQARDEALERAQGLLAARDP